MAYRVFISHSTDDLWVARQIERCIRELGGETFFDAYDIDVGVFETRLFETLPTCREFVVLFTPWSVRRNWLWVEMGAARVCRLQIVPILYKTTLGEIDENLGGATFLHSLKVIDINALDDYFDGLGKRIGDGR